MQTAHLIDVTGLEPPQPLERVLAAIEALSEGDYLHVRHHREPFLLYPILENRGFAFLTRLGRDAPFEIFIWRRGDEPARIAVQHLATHHA